MNFPDPDDEIERLFAEFMADQEGHLSPESYLQYAGIIDLLDFYLDCNYRPECSRREHDAPARSYRTFRGIPQAVDLTRRFSVFLDDFLPRETDAGAETLRLARKVIKALGIWLIAKGYVIRSERARKRANKSEYTPYFPGFFRD